MKKTRIFAYVLVVCFLAVMAFSGYQLWKINTNYADEAKIHNAVMEYKPDEITNPDPVPAITEIVNQKIIDLQAEYPDAVGWLTIPNTKIDYPFVWYNDNDYYLYRDINGAYAAAGSLFIDYRCDKDFSDQNTIIYGHHMRNGSMFGTLKAFDNQEFFNENKTGSIYLPYANLTLEFFAYMVINPNEGKELHDPMPGDAYYDYVKQNARYYRDLGLAEGDKIVTLSSCAYEFDDARMILLAKCS